MTVPDCRRFLSGHSVPWKSDESTGHSAATNLNAQTGQQINIPAMPTFPMFQQPSNAALIA